MSVKPIPEGYHTITPYLIVEDAIRLIEFLETAFEAEITFRMQDDEGRIRHAEARVGDSMLMLAEASEEWPANRTFLLLYVANADEVYRKALAAGGVSVKEPTDEIYGDRNATVKDEFGNFWGISTHIEDVSEAEFEERERAKRQSA